MNRSRGWAGAWLGAALIAAAVGLGGCTSGSTTALMPPAQQYELSTLTLREGAFAVDTVSDENRGKIRSALMQRLYKPGAFTEGPDLTLTYRVTQYDKGSRAARYWSSGLGGAGTLTIEAEYTDRSGMVLSRSAFTGKVSSGGWGGDFSGAIDAIANQIANYTLKHFTRQRPASEPGL